MKRIAADVQGFLAKRPGLTEVATNLALCLHEAFTRPDVFWLSVTSSSKGGREQLVFEVWTDRGEAEFRDRLATQQSRLMALAGAYWPDLVFIREDASQLHDDYQDVIDDINRNGLRRHQTNES